LRFWKKASAYAFACSTSAHCAGGERDSGDLGRIHASSRTVDRHDRTVARYRHEVVGLYRTAPDEGRFASTNLGLILVATLASLAGSEWGPKTEAKPERFVQFKEAKVAGHAWRNRFFGHYTLEGTAIKIGPLASTRMACPPEVMQAEQAWLRMLESARTAEATHKELVLKDAAGAVIATLKRRNWD
jgi:heat shock protein HslJ